MIHDNIVNILKHIIFLSIYCINTYILIMLIKIMVYLYTIQGLFPCLLFNGKLFYKNKEGRKLQ